MKNIDILYIDDEENNINSFKANLRLLYNIHGVTNTRDAESVLKNNPDIRIIVCDYKMPGESGVDFFRRIKNIYPQPIRILLTAYADMSIVIAAINEGNIFKFIRKPYVIEEVISTIEESNQFYSATSLLERRNVQLQQAYDELDKFAYSISHDLRDPLGSVLSAISYAMELQRVEEISEMLLLMQKSISKLDQYIDHLREYYLVRRGELNLRDIDFKCVAQDIRAFYQIAAQQHHINLDIEVHQHTSFKNDLSLIELIVYNLLNNAFKYYKKEELNKQVWLDIQVANGFVRIKIKDNGIGIPQSDHQEIFKLFYRANAQAPGMGFGLYNIKSALLKLNGSIEVDSQLGLGTTFTVEIPSK